MDGKLEIHDPLVDEFQAAPFVARKVTVLRGWRRRGEGPRFYWIGAAVRYRLSDLEAWLESRPCGGEDPGMNHKEAASVRDG